MELEFIRFLMEAGTSTVFLGFVLWKMVPAMGAIEFAVTKHAERFATYAEMTEKNTTALNVRYDQLLTSLLGRSQDPVTPAAAEAITSRLQESRDPKAE